MCTQRLYRAGVLNIYSSQITFCILLSYLTEWNSGSLFRNNVCRKNIYLEETFSILINGLLNICFNRRLYAGLFQVIIYGTELHMILYSEGLHEKVDTLAPLVCF